MRRLVRLRGERDGLLGKFVLHRRIGVQLTVISKQPVGYEDAEVTIELELCDREEGDAVAETARERLEKLQKLFRASREALPQPLEIVSTLTEACGIRRALFKELEVHDNELNFISCTLQLTEFESVETHRLQASGIGHQDGTEPQSPEVKSGESKLNEALGNPEEDYLIRQYDQGKADAMGE